MWQRKKACATLRTQRIMKKNCGQTNALSAEVIHSGFPVSKGLQSFDNRLFNERIHGPASHKINRHTEKSFIICDPWCPSWTKSNLLVNQARLINLVIAQAQIGCQVIAPPDS